MTIDAAAGQPLDDTDVRVLHDLRHLHAELDPMPGALTDDVKFALTVQALHAEVADLQRLESGLTGVRSVDYTRATTFTFTGGAFTTMVSVIETAPGELRIDGWLTGGDATVELRERQRSSSVDVEDEGRFAFEGVQRGLVQFVLYPKGQGADATPVITPSIDL